MGFSKTVYIGPYITVKHRTEQRIVNEKFHPDTGVKYSGDAKFCPHTGKEFRVVPKTVEKTVSLKWFSDIKEPLREDAFFNPEYPSLKGISVHIPTSTKGSYSNDDTFVYDMSDVEVEKKLSVFRDKYDGYIQYLYDNNWQWTLHYGVIQYAS